MRQTNPWPILIGVGVVLAVVFAGWVFASGSGGGGVAIVELLCGLLLLQLPAVGWRMAGGSLVQVLVVAIIVPLVVAEAWLAVSAAQNNGHGGDLQGIEYTLAWVVIVPIVASAAIVTLLSIRLIPIEPSAGD